MAIPEKVEICDDFSIIDVDIEKIPSIEKIFENNKEVFEAEKKK
jgi:hypothetical protein